MAAVPVIITPPAPLEATHVLGPLCPADHGVCLVDRRGTEDLSYLPFIYSLFVMSDPLLTMLLFISFLDLLLLPATLHVISWMDVFIMPK
jgi:hypothetical protein